MGNNPIFGTSLLLKGERLYKACLTIRDGEFEYLEETFVKAKSIESATAKMADYARRNFDDEELAKPVDDGSLGWYEEPHGWRWIKVSSIREMCSLEEAVKSIGIIE